MPGRTYQAPDAPPAPATPQANGCAPPPATRPDGEPAFRFAVPGPEFVDFGGPGGDAFAAGAPRGPPGAGARAAAPPPRRAACCNPLQHDSPGDRSMRPPAARSRRSPTAARARRVHRAVRRGRAAAGGPGRRASADRLCAVRGGGAPAVRERLHRRALLGHPGVPGEAARAPPAATVRASGPAAHGP